MEFIFFHKQPLVRWISYLHKKMDLLFLSRGVQNVIYVGVVYTVVFITLHSGILPVKKIVLHGPTRNTASLTCSVLVHTCTPLR